MDNIDEYKCLQEWSKKKMIILQDLYDCDKRYQRYLRKISYWMDEAGNDYEYIRTKVYEFLQIPNTYENCIEKFNRMKYIDGELLMMMSMVLMREMEM